GMGDVDLRDAGTPRAVELSSGMGDVDVARLRCTNLRAETGMGDVSTEDLEADELELSSGMGDVDVRRSKGSHVTAESGFGAVEQRNLEWGLGSVKER